MQLTTTLVLPTAATSLAVAFLGHCLEDATAGLPYDVARAAALLDDDHVYFAAAGTLVEPGRCRGWHALAHDLPAHAAGRAAVLARGCAQGLRNALEVIVLGELAAEPELRDAA